MTRTRVNEILPIKGGVTRSLRKEKKGYLLVQSDKRDTAAVVEDTRFNRTVTCTMYCWKPN